MKEIGQTKEQTNEYMLAAVRVTKICIACNLFLCLIKMIAGFAANSTALVNDGFNSGFDVLSGIIVIIGAKLAAKNPDREHPYGHERLESVATIVLAIILLVTGVFMGHSAIESLLSGAYQTFQMPGKLTIIAALISIATKETLFWYTKSAADKLNSVSLKAAARDHQADVIATLGALIGILFSRYGFPMGDVIASLVVCLFIIRTAYKVFCEAISQMTDKSCDDEFLNELRECILSVDGVLGIDMLQVRAFGNKYYVDLEIRENGNIKLSDAHKVAELVHDKIEAKYPAIKHIMIHVNPDLT